MVIKWIHICPIRPFVIRADQDFQGVGASEPGKSPDRVSQGIGWPSGSGRVSPLALHYAGELGAPGLDGTQGPVARHKWLGGPVLDSRAGGAKSVWYRDRKNPN